MKVIFFGTPQLCTPYLEMLSTEHELLAVVCNPDQPAGRKMLLTPPPTKVWAHEHDIPVLQPEKLRGFDSVLADYQADLYIVVAYGKIIPSALINQPQYGTLNVHYSLLPRWRGASPVEAAVLAGDTVSGVCIQQMRFELDSGPIWASQEVQIGPNDYARTLRDGVMGEVGLRLLRQTVDIIQTISNPTLALPFSRGGKPEIPREQVGEPTFCYRIKREDGELLDSDSDLIRWRKFRAYYPWPGVFYWDADGKRVKINEAQFDNGRFIPTTVTRDGSKPEKIV
jgi:methionyl-tRNA formyltransferase